MARPFVAMLERVREIAPTVKSFHFRLDGLDVFDFIPGQFVTLLFPLPELGAENKRSYSIASYPDGQPRIELAVTRVDTGVASKWLHDREPGAAIPGSGPYGFFVLDQPPNADLCFVATGTGITPIRPMLRRVFEIGTPHSVTLLFGCRHPGDILYRAEFEALAQQHPNFHFVPTLSQPDSAWSGRTGYVQTHIERDFIASTRTDTQFFVCGLKKMVEDVRGKLRAAGWDRKAIHRELYD